MVVVVAVVVVAVVVVVLLVVVVLAIVVVAARVVENINTSTNSKNMCSRVVQEVVLDQ